MPQFLSQDWFDEVKKLSHQFNLPTDKTLESLKINVTTTGVQGTTHLHIINGFLEQGLHEQATTTIYLSEELLRKIFFEHDMNAIIMGFMTNKIKIQGDMSQLSALQNRQITDQQKALFKEILKMTQ